jgi:hypothetical protein
MRADDEATPHARAEDVDCGGGHDRGGFADREHAVLRVVSDATNEGASHEHACIGRVDRC